MRLSAKIFITISYSKNIIKIKVFKTNLKNEATYRLTESMKKSDIIAFLKNV